MSNQSAPYDLSPNAAAAETTTKPKQWRARVTLIRDTLGGANKNRFAISRLGLATIVTAWLEPSEAPSGLSSSAFLIQLR